MKGFTAVLLIFVLLLSMMGCTEAPASPTDGTPTIPVTRPTDGTTPPTETDPAAPTIPTQATDPTPATEPNTPTQPTEGPKPTVPTAPSEPADGPEPTEPVTDDEEALFGLLFDIENKIDLQLDMTPGELAKMQADYDRYDRNGTKSPIYRKGDLHITITTPDGARHTYTIEEVGVRMKGNTSRTDFYDPQNGIYNIIHLKISFQETFDDPAYYGSEAKVWDAQTRKERKNRTFATLEKMDLRWNRCDDSTYLKEYFAYATYRQYGVLAPHTNLATLNWAGNHMGVFSINEPIDKVFLEKNLPQEALGGDLYKIGWAGNHNGNFTSFQSVGIENEDEGKFYAYDLKTNKKTSAHESLKKLILELNDGSVTKEDFAGLVDLESFLPYCAVSYLLGNPDDLRNNYNNCYLYFRADNGKAIIIPYDYDRCLGVTTHWNPTGHGLTADDPFGTTVLATNDEQRSPLFRYSVIKGGHYVREYAQLLKEIAKGHWFTYDNFRRLYNIAERHYAEDARLGKEFHNAGHLYLSFDLEKTSDFSSQGNISFREYLDAKIRNMTKFLEKTDENADAKPPAAPTGWYIRADYTDWNISNDHILTQQNGLWVYEVTLQWTSKLKIFNDILGQWYGTECISEDCAVAYETDHHSNIILPGGSYRISIDPETNIITIEER